MTKLKKFHAFLFSLFIATNVSQGESVSYSKNYDRPYGKKLHIALPLGVQGSRAMTLSLHSRYEVYPGLLEIHGLGIANVLNMSIDNGGFSNQYEAGATLQLGRFKKSSRKGINLESVVNYVTQMAKVKSLKKVGDLGISYFLSGGIWGRNAGMNVKTTAPMAPILTMEV